MSHYIRTKSKIPLKCFVWLKKRKDSEINFKEVKYFDVVSEKFESADFNVFVKENNEITKLIRTFLDNNNFSWWLDIDILSETTRWHSFWFSGTTFAILALDLFVLTWLLDIKILDNYEEFMSSEVFKQVYKLALSMEFRSRKWNTIWQNIINTLSNYKEPTVFFTEVFTPLIQDDEIDDLYTKHIPLSKIFDDTITNDITLDYLMVYSWIPTNSKQIDDFKRADKINLNKQKVYLDEYILWEDSKDKNIFLNNIITENKTIYDHMADVLWILNIKTVQLFHEMFKKWFDEALSEEFIEHINHYRYILSITEKQWNFADDFIYYFKNNRKNTNEKIWIMPTWSGKLGWWFVVVLKSWISRETIEKTIEDLNNNYSWVKIEYSSYEDWDTSDWIILEQYISESVYSSYVEKDFVIMKNNRNESIIGKYNSLIAIVDDWLLLDTISSKMYYNWEKLTSKDIHSQNSTVEILATLVENVWIEVTSASLPKSSYSKSKSEMIGKIIVPLIKFIENKTWEKFPLVCKWNLLDFFIKLWDTNLKISIIKKL